MKQEKIGKFIKEKRLKKNLTQSEFANILGVTERTVSNWENGKNLPDLSLYNDIYNRNLGPVFWFGRLRGG